MQLFSLRGNKKGPEIDLLESIPIWCMNTRNHIESERATFQTTTEEDVIMSSVLVRDQEEVRLLIYRLFDCDVTHNVIDGV